MKGNAANAIFPIFRPDNPMHTNKFTPKGGVDCPMAKFVIIRRPRNIGSMPSFRAMGKKMGVNMKIMAFVSRKQPAISITTLMIRRNAVGEDEYARMPSPRRPAMPCVVRIHENKLADPIMINTMPLKMADSDNIFKKAAGLIFL